MKRRILQRILLVEDDLDIHGVVEVLLSDIEGFEVRACGSAAEALQAVQTFAPDLILLDVMMPGLHGRGAFAAFRETPATAATPVIFLTACVQPPQIMEYRKLGALGVIPKPFDPETLAATIREMWSRDQEARLNETRREDLATLRRVYAAELPDRLRALEATTLALQQDGTNREVATSLCEMAHRLAGSAAIYGFPGVSEAALRIVAFANEHQSGPWTVVASRSLLKLVATLSTALQESAPAKG